MEVLVEGKIIRLTPNQIIGQGSEAYVYGVGKNALKIFKEPTHPDFAGNTFEQEASRQRLAEHQKKLPSFPTNLPPNVVVPEKLVTNNSGTKILGYQMRQILPSERLVRYSDQTFRRAGIDTNQVVSIFQNLYQSVQGLHSRGVVIGDFKDLNVLVSGTEAYLIDSDSFQFGSFFCTMFSELFVDPLLSDPSLGRVNISKPYEKNSDWYAFSVMLFESLLFVHPFFGGVYRPKNKADQVSREQRPLKRISVFNPEVIYPKPALPLKLLPDDLLDYFQKVFTKNSRGVFPETLLRDLRWTKCTSCSHEHARNVCPFCQTNVPRTVQTVRVRGKVTVTTIFKTNGLILTSNVQNGKLYYLYHVGGKFLREGGREVLTGNIDPSLKFGVHQQKTIAGMGDKLLVLEKNNFQELVTESVNNQPIFAGNGEEFFWIQNGTLVQQNQFGPRHWANVFRNQTRVWVGESFGFGFYRAGPLEVYFVFGTKLPGIKDSVKLPPISGELVDTEVVFSEKNCWFFLTVEEKNKIINRCYQINSNGDLIASSFAEKGDGTWLGKIKGNAATGKFLFSSTDEGIVRVEELGGKLEETAKFPDTEPFVDSDSQLLFGEGGLFVIGAQEIVHLKIN